MGENGGLPCTHWSHAQTEDKRCPDCAQSSETLPQNMFLCLWKLSDCFTGRWWLSSCFCRIFKILCHSSLKLTPSHLSPPSLNSGGNHMFFQALLMLPCVWLAGAVPQWFQQLLFCRGQWGHVEWELFPSRGRFAHKGKHRGKKALRWEKGGRVGVTPSFF